MVQVYIYICLHQSKEKTLNICKKMDEQAPIYITKMEVIIFLPKNIYILLTASLAKVETVLWSKRKNTPIIQHAPQTR